jgi:hypothetical protein
MVSSPDVYIEHSAAFGPRFCLDLPTGKLKVEDWDSVVVYVIARLFAQEGHHFHEGMLKGVAAHEANHKEQLVGKATPAKMETKTAGDSNSA